MTLWHEAESILDRLLQRSPYSDTDRQAQKNDQSAIRKLLLAAESKLAERDTLRELMLEQSRENGQLSAELERALSVAHARHEQEHKRLEAHALRDVADELPPGDKATLDRVRAWLRDRADTIDPDYPDYLTS